MSRRRDRGQGRGGGEAAAPRSREAKATAKTGEGQVRRRRPTPRPRPSPRRRSAAPARPAGDGRMVHLSIRRQDGADQPETRRWEEFEVPYLPQMNVISALMEIQKNPQTTDGKKVAPVVWEAACLEEVCGSCTMIDQRTRAAGVLGARRSDRAERRDDHARADDQVPARARSHRRSLAHVRGPEAREGVDRSRRHARARPGPARVARRTRKRRYPLSRCMTCGCCLEACPQSTTRRRSSAPAAINQVRLFNLHPSGQDARRASASRR